MNNDEKKGLGFSNEKIVEIFLIILAVVVFFMGAIMAKNSGLDHFRNDKIVAIQKGGGMINYEKIATENFARWNDALQSRDAKKVAELYLPDATFLPTMSPKFMNGKEEAEGYFKHFLKKNPAGKVVAEKVQVLSPSIYLHSGLYNFQVDESGDRHIVEARFTFLWKLDEQGIWKIAHHHSSVKPKG